MSTVGKPFTQGDPNINRRGRPPGIDAAIRRHVAPNLERLAAVCAEAGVSGDPAAASAALLLFALRNRKE